MKIVNTVYFLSLALPFMSAGLNADAADQSMCHPGANVLLHDNGSLKACQLEDNYEVNGIQCKRNNPVSFYNNGNLESCMLSKPAAIGTSTCKEDGLISFYIDGKLKSCVKPGY